MNDYYENNTDRTQNYSYTEPGVPEPSGNRRPRHRRKSGRRVLALTLGCAVLGGAIGSAGTLLATGGTGTGASTSILTGSRSVSSVTLTSVDTSEELTAAEVYAQNVNSTVGITTTTTTNYFGYQTTSAASGSGFILTSDGYVLTNYHVIEDSTEITVTTYDDTAYPATLTGYDESNDIAVLKVEATDLTPVVLGDSDSLNVGDSVIAIGNPLGELTFSLTSGVVSALNRTVTLSTSSTMELIQTDCAINSGNSGGALFNMYGEVIGITNAKYSSSGSSSEASIDNIGFAIPINSVKDIVTEIIETGTIEKSYIGISVSDVSSSGGYMGGSSISGAQVQSVTEGSPAEDAGLSAGDIITMVDGSEISGSSELSSIISSSEAGDQLTLTVYRNGETMELTVTVGTQTASALPDTETDTSEESTGSSGMNPWGYGNGDSYGGNSNGSSEGSSDSYGSSTLNYSLT